MLVRADDERLNTVIAKRLSGLQAMDSLDQNITLLAFAHMNRLFFILFHDCLGNLIKLFGIKFLAAFSRHVNILNFNNNGLKQIATPSLYDDPEILYSASKLIKTMELRCDKKTKRVEFNSKKQGAPDSRC